MTNHTGHQRHSGQTGVPGIGLRRHRATLSDDGAGRAAPVKISMKPAKENIKFYQILYILLKDCSKKVCF